MVERRMRNLFRSLNDNDIASDQRRMNIGGADLASAGSEEMAKPLVAVAGEGAKAMAETVAVYVVPHTPSFVAEVQLNGERSQTAQFFSKIRSHLENVKPDVIVTVNNDHFNTFFFDNWPTFAIGAAERTAGPNDQTPGMPRYELAIETGAARHTLRYLVEDGFTSRRPSISSSTTARSSHCIS